MRINELKIYGFKSFANKTSIRFDDNFVGIVGPNGSGKSNIIDAVRWVFGEQSSKSMRGNASTDVIFNGSIKRKKQNIAEVTLVLDNGDRHLALDYEEVSVTRRLYRSGESEYLINGIDCRLKDITELMMDSGMGKSSFSIISQGKIEEIVVSKPENRRAVIEEVAGITKYKKRKEVAFKKLEKTDQNLEQVDFILNEMNERLIPLKKQSQKATEHQEIKEKLTNIEVSYLANIINELNEDYQGMKKLLSDYELKDLELTTKQTTCDSELTIIDENIREKSVLLNQCNLKYSKLVSQTADLKANYKILQDKINNSLDSLEDKRMLELETEIVSFKTNISQKEQQFISAKHSTEAAKIKLNQVIEKLNLVRKQKFENENELSQINDNIERASYPFAIKKVITNHQFKEFLVVADIFTTEIKYASAIASALGGRINEVVAPNLEIIKSAIEFLRKNKFGRATFLNISNIKTYKVEQKYIDICNETTGFIGLATKLIKNDSQYDQVFNNLLSNAIIVDTIDNGNILAKRLFNRFRIITLDGDVISTSGSISGGANNKISSVVLKQNKENITRQLKSIEDNIGMLNEQYQENEAKYHDQNSIENKINSEIQSLKNDKKLKEYELSSIAPSETYSTNELGDINSDLENSNLELNQVHENIENLKQVIEDLNDKKENLNHDLRNISQDIRIFDKESTEYKIKTSQIESRLEGFITRLREDYNLDYRYAFEKAQKNIDLEEFEIQIKSFKNKLKVIGVVNLDSITEYVQVKERYDFIEGQKEDLNKAKDKLVNIITKLDEVVIEQFSDSYAKLRSEFQIIYKELFGGGQADLVLTNPENLLQTGVEIVAQPPGKKLQTISLLSGGEKSLTAISLLFSILRVRTVPFAILDEVEAALDEANVRRYARYIKIFSERTQFLVITHRQGTMELVDNLYGITMIEKGVSSVVKVKLNEEGKNV